MKRTPLKIINPDATSKGKLSTFKSTQEEGKNEIKKPAIPPDMMNPISYQKPKI